MAQQLRYYVSVMMLVVGVPYTAHAEVETNTSQVQSGHYMIEPTHTQILFSVNHFGFSDYSGMMSNISGTLDLDVQTPVKSHVAVTIPVDSIQTTSATLNDELKGEPWFNASKYPNATFQSSAITSITHNEALLEGNLTLRGVTHPETLKIHFIGAGINMFDKKYTVGFEASTTIKRSDYGIKMFVPYVSDEVHLRIAGAFEK